MRRRVMFEASLFLVITLLFASSSLSFDKPTHRAVNQAIAEMKILDFSLNEFLIKQLGFKKGIEETYPFGDDKKAVWWWLGYGGFMEDEPEGYLRYPINAARNNNHFHNPLASPWSSAGFDKTIIIPGFLLPLHVFGQSSVLWAQNEAQHLGGKWSWQDARKYFFEALTAVKKVDKDRAMADTFRAVGQLMHLIQDASVPAHTRNEIHRPFYHYETWLEKLRTDLEGAQTFQNLIASPIPFDPNILTQTDDPKARVPIANIVDTNSYSGSNPGVTASPSQGLPAVGLSEYANANFFGESTIFKKFPYPSMKTSVTEGSWVIQDPRDKSRLIQRKYYVKTADGETGHRLATVGALRDYLVNYAPDGVVNDRPGLDAEVYTDYAKKLLPRAVGYSAGVLKYFFRGKLQVLCLPILYKNGIQYVRLTVKNLTPTRETIKGGFITLTYRYTPKDGRPDGSDDIFGEAWAAPNSMAAPCPELRYGDEDEVTLDFTVLPEPIPLESWESVKLTLAFKGTLGEEQGAVIGKVVTLGEIKFNEEWDKDLTGNHTWAQTDFNLIGQNPQNGSTSNVLSGDVLVKDNIRYRGHKTARVNETFVATWVNNGEFKDILPIPITPASYLQFKIDSMSINAIPPAEPGETNQFQGLWLYFSKGRVLQLTQEGQGFDYTPTTASYTFELGRIIVDNIYDLFENAGLPIEEESINLHGINFLQQLFDMKEPSTVDHHQHMEVDFIRVIEAKEE